MLLPSIACKLMAPGCLESSKRFDAATDAVEIGMQGMGPVRAQPQMAWPF